MLHDDAWNRATQTSHPLSVCQGDDTPILEVLDHWVAFHTPSPNTSSFNKQRTRAIHMLPSTRNVDRRCQFQVPGLPSGDRLQGHNISRSTCQFHGASHPLLAVDFEPVSSHDRHAAFPTRITYLPCRFQGTSHFSPAVDFEPILYRDPHFLSVTSVTQHIQLLSPVQPYVT